MAASNRKYAAPESPKDVFFEKGLPSSAEAEQSVLGGILLDNRLIDEARTLLKPAHFFFADNRRFYSAMLAIAERGGADGFTIDPVTLAEELHRTGDFERVRGHFAISRLIDGVPRTDTIAYYAKIIRAKALLRGGITLCNQTIAACVDDEEPPEEIFSRHGEAMHELTSAAIAKQAQHAADIGQRYLESVEQVRADGGHILGLSTGLIDFDEVTSGLRPGNLYVIAGRTSMGKTALLGNIAKAASQRGNVVGWFELEQTEEELLARLIADMARVPHDRLEHNYMGRDEWSRCADALRTLQGMPLLIDDTPNLTVGELGARARKMRAENRKLYGGSGLDLLLVDYMQLLSGGARFAGHMRQYESREQEVTRVSKELKELAKELKVPLVATAQLSRATESRSDHKPILADLRESGGIENNADVVCLLYREEYYKPSDENRGLAELIFAKVRGGRQQTRSVAFFGEFYRFAPLWDDGADRRRRAESAKWNSSAPRYDGNEPPEETAAD